MDAKCPLTGTTEAQSVGIARATKGDVTRKSLRNPAENFRSSDCDKTKAAKVFLNEVRVVLQRAAKRFSKA
jgi:DNA-binding transcriptional regulator YdaS (Cro superfamily)